jgi:hypothetical protein
LFCSTHTFSQVVQLDSNNVKMDKSTFKGVTLKLIELNTIKKLLVNTEQELLICDEQKSLLEDDVIVLKSRILMYEVMLKAQERPFWDKFWIGFGSAIALIVGIGIVII